MVFKCKMCAGEMDFQKGSGIAECPYCGSKQTLPKLQDEKMATLYERANHYRRSSEFDKAIGIFEQILNEDNTDSEAYWSLVLCRYGIEYVEDPATKKQVPTIHRAQYTSVFADEDYKKAIEFASKEQKVVYATEAKAIDDIQKNILAISQNEEPFDVFICYKETDENGNRTQDSVIANDLYHQLTAEGFKVFFARITLEDKLGSAYEPYIFAALNSAKVMVAIGTKPEYFNAVWVRNEWSRYLDLIKKGEDKVLIPAYKDMDAYSLPSEFAYLQSQDMSKIGFLQDLIRGIQKIVKPLKENKSTSQSSNAATASVLSLIKNKWKILVPAVAIIVAITIGAVFMPMMNASKTDSSSSTKVDAAEKGLITTKYLTMQVPDYWEGNYIVDIPQGTGYDIVTDEFSYWVKFYEKTGYTSNGSGHLFSVFIQTEPFHDFYGEPFAEFVSDKTYYLFLAKPTDVQWTLANQEIYSKMLEDRDSIINSIESTGEHRIVFYE